MKGIAPTQLLRAATRHRALLSGGLAAGAVAAALSVLAPSGQEGVAVLTAAHDLATGVPLTEADLARVVLPASVVPTGALRPEQSPVGRLLAGPVRRGEPLTDVRLLGPGLLAGLDRDLVAVPLRLADPAAAAYLQPGDRVDVLGAGSPAGTVAVVASRLTVLAVPALEGDVAEGALVVVAAGPAVATRLAAAAAGGPLTATVLPR